MYVFKYHLLFLSNLTEPYLLCNVVVNIVIKTEEINCNIIPGKITKYKGIRILSSGVYFVLGILIVNARKLIFESYSNWKQNIITYNACNAVINPKLITFDTLL